VPARDGIRACLTIVDPPKLTTAAARFRSCQPTCHGTSGHTLQLSGPCRTALDAQGRMIDSGRRSAWPQLGQSLEIRLISRFVRRQPSRLRRRRFLDGRKRYGRLVVSRTTFSGHLRTDLIRIIDLSMTSCLANIDAGVGRHQLAISRRTTSALPTTVKYLAMGTTDDSRELSNRPQLMVAMLDRSHIARQIDLAGSLAPAQPPGRAGLQSVLCQPSSTKTGSKPARSSSRCRRC
jgi:hypothetical protein